MASTILRRSSVRGRPIGLGAGKSGSIISHCESVRSVAYGSIGTSLRHAHQRLTDFVYRLLVDSADRPPRPAAVAATVRPLPLLLDLHAALCCCLTGCALSYVYYKYYTSYTSLSIRGPYGSQRPRSSHCRSVVADKGLYAGIISRKHGNTKLQDLKGKKARLPLDFFPFRSVCVSSTGKTLRQDRAGGWLTT